MEHTAGVVEHLAHVGALSGELVARSVDVEHDELQALTEPGAAAVTPVPKMIEHAEPGGVSCTTRKSEPVARSASSRHPSDW
jgi:hypothetical protein